MSVRALVMALVVPLALLAGCGGGPSSPSSSGGSASSDPSEAVDGPVCAEVRAGIDAFNRADFAGTVDHFKTAVPLAEEAARSDSSQSAADLLEAVRYYADLEPDDYPSASADSPRFAEYKAITLGQCASPGAEPSDDGPPAQSA